MRARSGSRLGSYELGERLGAGGMAEVYVGSRAGPHGFNKRFAIKLILPQLAQDPRFVQMFCDEARICAALTHPNIVQVNDFGESDGRLFMAMEFVDGVSCAKLLRAVAARGERFPLGSALFIAHEVLRALTFAHEARDEHGRPLGIVHRDVSPGNVLIGRAGEVKLTDFGIVRSSFIDRRTYPGELKGKMGYMSPEQVVGAELDARSDLFTVGIILAEMLLCRPLFPGRNELDILSRIFEADLRVLERYGQDLPDDLRSALHIALSREPHARFQSAREFAEALRSVARRSGVSLTEADLSPWVNGLGVLASATSGMREAVAATLRPRASSEGVPAQSGRHALAPAAPESAAFASTEPPPASGRALRPGGPSFHLRTARGNVVGPLRLSQLLELVATGRIAKDTAVSTDGGRFRPAAEVPQIARLCERPAFDYRRPEPSRATWQTPLNRLRLPETLFACSLEDETGLLVAQGELVHKRIYFSAGVPSFVASSDRSELLGARLLQSQAISRADLESALLASSEPGAERLGEVLVRRGLLRPTALLRALIEQLEQRFIELGSWSTGTLTFYRGEQSGEDQLKLPTIGPALITRLVRENYPDAELAELLGPMRSLPLERGRVPRLDLAELGLTTNERIVLGCAGTGVSLERLAQTLASAHGVTIESTLRAVFIGLSCGLLSSPGFSGSS